MRVVNRNWSATKQRLHVQSVAEISRHSVLSSDRIQKCETSTEIVFIYVPLPPDQHHISDLAKWKWILSHENNDDGTSKTQHLWDLTESDDVERLGEADTDETELCGVVIAIPDQQLSVGLNRLHRPVVDVSCRLDCSHVLAVHAAGTVDKPQPVWSIRIPTIHKVRWTTTFVDLYINTQQMIRNAVCISISVLAGLA